MPDSIDMAIMPKAWKKKKSPISDAHRKGLAVLIKVMKSYASAVNMIGCLVTTCKLTMNPLRELVLQSLKHACMPKSWNIIIDPDPRKYLLEEMA